MGKIIAIKSLLLFVCFCLLGLTDAKAQADGATDIQVENLRKSWQRREESLKTLKLNWSEVRTQPKGYFNLLGVTRGAKPEHPPKDLQLSGQGLLLLDRAKMRLEVARKKWSTKYANIADSEEIYSYDENRNVSLTTKSSLIDYPDAEIDKKRKAANIMEYALWPITAYARGLNPRYCPFNLSKFERTGQEFVIDGRRCFEMKCSTRANSSNESVLIDSARDFVMLRYQVVVGGRTTVRLDVHYRQDADSLWVPNNWDYVVTTPTGMLLESNRIKVESLDLNPDIDSSTIAVKLPPKTRVHDSSTGETIQYVIRDDGEPGSSIADSADPSYSELANRSHDDFRNSPRRIVAFLAAGVSVLVLLVIVWRKRILGRAS